MLTFQLSHVDLSEIRVAIHGALNASLNVPIEAVLVSETSEGNVEVCLDHSAHNS